jgi:hypothetical protein
MDRTLPGGRAFRREFDAGEPEDAELTSELVTSAVAHGRGAARADQRRILASSRSSGRPREQSERAVLYVRVAETLEQSARLAEQHAERDRRNGRPDSAAAELERARRAREAARRGRALASQVLRTHTRNAVSGVGAVDRSATRSGDVALHG